MHNIKGDSKKALKFLQAFEKPIQNLAKLHPSASSISAITRPSNHNDLETFIIENNGKENIYWTPNQPYPSAPSNKLKKEHIDMIHYVWIDADPIKDKDFKLERVRLKQFVNDLNDSAHPPTFIIDSGGGYQAFWKLKSPISAHNSKTHVEAIGKGLAIKFNTDPVQNIDRLMRLPYTVNLPTKTKVGRSPALATVVHASMRRYDLEELKSFCDPVYETLDDVNYDVELNMADLRPTLPEELKERWDNVKNDPTIRNLCNSTLTSRSEYDMKLTSRLKELDFNLQDTAKILYLFEKGKNKDLSKREIIRTYERCTNSLSMLKLPEVDILKIDSQINPSTITPETTLKLYDEQGNEKPKRVQIVNALDMDYTNDVDWLYDDFLMKYGFNVMYGQSGAGKSFAMLDLAVHLAWGASWNGLECPKKMAVLYIAAEAGRGMGKRVEAARRKLGIPRDATIEEFPLRIIPMAVDLMSKPTDIQDDIADIIIHGKRLIRDSGLELGMVVFDTLSTTFAGGNENSSEDMGKYVTNTTKIREELGTSVSIVHHAGKDQSLGARGHSLLRAATDTEIEVRAERCGEKWKREIEVKKQREGETGGLFKFGLNKVVVGVNSRGKDVTSCQIVLENDVEFSSVIPSKFDELTLGQQQMFNAIRVCEHLETRSTGWVNGWFSYIVETSTNEYNSLVDYAQKEHGIVEMKGKVFGNKVRTMQKYRSHLQENGLVEENHNNQWFTLS